VSESLDTSPLLAFYGDDFTGSTDALESLARQGVRTVLFTDPPTPDDLRQHPNIQAFGVAGRTRAMSPEAMEEALRPAFASLCAVRPRFIHYKTCSTFDSAPHLGSIGRAIDVGFDVLGVSHVPVFVAAPDLGRYCALGNLFARFGTDPDVFRLDRHPSMSRHPTTPMHEADIRLHLAGQTTRTVGLLDLPHLEMDTARRDARLLEARHDHPIVLIDGYNANHVATVGDLLHDFTTDGVTFVVGSSGVESALCDRWRRDGICPGESRFDAVTDVGPIVVLCGSCSPVTARQIDHARAHGFTEIAFDGSVVSDTEHLLAAIVRDSIHSLEAGRSVVVHSSGATGGNRTAVAGSAQSIGRFLGTVASRVLERTLVRRVAVAGGDTSSEIARVLRIRSVEMIGELTRGSPLCRAAAPGSPADGREFTFKGGQIGPADFFTRVRHGTATTSE
jgi:uncharacterized protein YgbK (DUF1537 family)